MWADGWGRVKSSCLHGLLELSVQDLRPIVVSFLTGDSNVFSIPLPDPVFVQNLARSLWRWHLGITASIFAVGASAAIFPEFGSRIAPTLGPQTHHVGLIVALVLTWVLLTVALRIACRPLEIDDLVLLLGTVLVSLLYLIFLRERGSFGDIGDYIQAGKTIRSADALPIRYIYPPLWAYVLSWIQSGLGDRASEIFCFVVNHSSIVASVPLMSMFLERCGWCRRSAALAVFAAIMFNTAVVRNVAYVQVNFLVLDLLLLGVLLPRRLWWLAALSLAIGIHVKLLPIVVLPLLLLEKRWLLLAGTLVLVTLLVGATAWPDGARYWKGFYVNLSAWQPHALRSASISGFFVSSTDLLGIPGNPQLLARAVQLVLAIVVLLTVWGALRENTFTRRAESRDGVVDGLLPMLFLWPVLSPTVWVHHLIVLILPALAVLPLLGTLRTVTVFIVCWFLVFLFPTVDIYPVSYLRLAGWLGFLSIMVLVVRKGRQSRSAAGVAATELALTFRGSKHSS